MHLSSLPGGELDSNGSWNGSGGTAVTGTTATVACDAATAASLSGDLSDDEEEEDDGLALPPGPVARQSSVGAVAEAPPGDALEEEAGMMLPDALGEAALMAGDAAWSKPGMKLCISHNRLGWGGLSLVLAGLHADPNVRELQASGVVSATETSAAVEAPSSAPRITMPELPPTPPLSESDESAVQALQGFLFPAAAAGAGSAALGAIAARHPLALARPRAHAAENSRLEELDLSSNCIGPGVAQLLGPVLCGLRGLERLRLGGNGGLGAAGLRWLLLASQTTCPQGSGAPCNDPLAPPVPPAPTRAALTRLRSLDLSRCGLDGPDGGRAIGQLLVALPDLEELELAGNALGSLGGAAVSAGLRVRGARFGSRARPLVLGVSGCQLGDQGALAVLGACCNGPVVRKLQLDNNQLTAGACSGVGRALSESKASGTCLRSLSLRENALIGDHGAAAIAAGLSGSLLSCLCLSQCNVGAEGGRRLNAAIGALTSMEVLQWTGQAGGVTVEARATAHETRALLQRSRRVFLRSRGKRREPPATILTGPAAMEDGL